MLPATQGVRLAKCNFNLKNILCVLAVYQDLSREHLLSIIQSLKNSSILQDEKGTSWEEITALPNNNEVSLSQTSTASGCRVKSSKLNW